MSAVRCDVSTQMDKNMNDAFPMAKHIYPEIPILSIGVQHWSSVFHAMRDVRYEYTDRKILSTTTRKQRQDQEHNKKINQKTPTKTQMKYEKKNDEQNLYLQKFKKFEMKRARW